MTTATRILPDSEGNYKSRSSQIEMLMAGLCPTVAAERRQEERVSIPILFRLTPLDGNREPIRSETAIVIAKNISRRGFSFYHAQPIPQRRALIELAQPEIGPFTAEIDIRWCRFTRPGRYESGGRLVRALVGSARAGGENRLRGGPPASDLPEAQDCAAYVASCRI
jgi:hypothetical protein